MIRHYLTDSPLWYIRHPWRFVRDLYCEIGAIIHRGFHGWDPSDTWSLDTYLATVLPDMLLHLAYYYNGAAECWWDDTPGDETHQWREYLVQTAKAFEMYRMLIQSFGTILTFEEEEALLSRSIDQMRQLTERFHELRDAEHKLGALFDYYSQLGD